MYRPMPPRNMRSTAFGTVQQVDDHPRACHQHGGNAAHEQHEELEGLHLHLVHDLTPVPGLSSGGSPQLRIVTKI